MALRLRLAGPVALAALVLLLGAPRAAADPPPATHASHVRGVDPDGVRLIAAARTRSAVVADLIDRLDASDVVVIVTPVTLTRMATGDMTWMGACARARYVRVRVNSTQPSLDQTIEWLAHELQHASELAAAPEVRDLSGFVALFARIGEEWKMHAFETREAIEVQRAVRLELRELRKRESARPAPAAGPTPVPSR